MIATWPKSERGTVPRNRLAEDVLQIAPARDATPVPAHAPAELPAKDDSVGPSPALTPEAIFHTHAPRFYNLARRLLGNEADAEDVTQDVFVQLLRKLPVFRGEAALPTWLYRVTVNAALAYRRKRAPRRGIAFPTCSRISATAGPTWLPFNPGRRSRNSCLRDQETHRLIEAAVARLPVMYRDVFVLAEVEDGPNPEVAVLLGLTVAAEKSRLHRARLLMRKTLSAHFGELAA